MAKHISAKIYHDGENYCARTSGIDVFTQGATFEEALDNLKDAVKLHTQN